VAKTYRKSHATRLINSLSRTLTRFGLGPPYLHILTVQGRKTGRPYSTPVDVLELDGQRWLVAPYGPVSWVANARAVICLAHEDLGRHSDARPGTWAFLEVTDTGGGMSPEVADRMFEPFFTTKDVGRGSGMGLATVHGIVHEHHGHIVVERSDPRGSRFRILLPPLADDATVPMSAPRPAADAPASARSRSLKGRVLVVDDEAPLAEFMRELLSGWGMEANAIHNPREALDAFSADPEAYDLVITDLAMPGTTGFALAREMLAIRPELPVILYTGHIDPIAQRELESAGIRALLPKPVEPDQLHGLLKTLLP